MWSAGRDIRSATGGEALPGRPDPRPAVLRSAFDAHREGRGEVVEIVAPPGMGKSHLVATFVADGPGPDVAVIGEIGQSIVPFAAIASPLRLFLGLDPDPAAAAVELTRRAGALAPLVAPALGLEMDATEAAAAIEPRSVPEQRIERLAQLVTIAQPGPGFLLVEDTHWLDPASTLILGELAGRLVARRWLVVSTSRPDGPFLGPRATTLELEPLGSNDLRRMAIRAAGEQALSDATLDALVARADGNALFLGQLVEAATTGGRGAA